MHKELPSPFHLSELLREETRERALARSAIALRGCVLREAGEPDGVPAFPTAPGKNALILRLKGDSMH